MGFGTDLAEGRTRVRETYEKLRAQVRMRKALRIFSFLFSWLFPAQTVFGYQADQIPNMFKPVSTPAHSIFHLSLFVLAICALIFAVVFSLLVYSIVKFRRRAGDDGREPPPIYGSNQVELAWTVIPVLIVVALFMATS